MNVSHEGRPYQVTHLFLISLRATPEILLQLVRVRWNIEGWNWIRDKQLHEDTYRYKCVGAGTMATLCTANQRIPRLAGFRPIRAGMLTAIQDITALFTIVRRHQGPNIN